jgi:putative transposase
MDRQKSPLVALRHEALVHRRREPHLLIQPNMRLKAKRTPAGRKPQPTTPREWWALDMTKVLVQSFGWVSIMVRLDWDTKAIVGSHACSQSTARQRLATLDMAVQRQFPEGGGKTGFPAE